MTSRKECYKKGNVTCVKKEGELMSNAVRKSGHVTADSGGRKIIKSTRLR